jgi:hypothetical protein
MEAMLETSLYSHLYHKLAIYLIIAYVFSSAKLQKSRAGSAWKCGDGEERKGEGARGKDGPNNVCTYE